MLTEYIMNSRCQNHFHLMYLCSRLIYVQHRNYDELETEISFYLLSQIDWVLLSKAEEKQNIYLTLNGIILWKCVDDINNINGINGNDRNTVTFGWVFSQIVIFYRLS